ALANVELDGGDRDAGQLVKPAHLEQLLVLVCARQPHRRALAPQPKWVALLSTIGGGRSTGERSRRRAAAGARRAAAAPGRTTEPARSRRHGRPGETARRRGRPAPDRTAARPPAPADSPCAPA